jgi:putative endonuclease
VTAYLKMRIHDHKTKRNPDCFTARYNIHKLVYIEGHDRIGEAIFHEKRLKGKSRRHKIDLITKFNPTWKDLYNEL